MANGTDSEQFVLLSGVRTGLKREFAFALKVQSELSGSLGRTRARKFQNSPTANGVSGNSSNKRFKNSHAKKEAKKEAKNDAAKPQIDKVLKRDVDKSLTEEEPKVDLAKATGGEETNNDLSEEPKVDLPEPNRVEEQKNYGPVRPQNDEAKSANEREKSEIAKPVNEEVTCLESPMLIDDGNKIQHASEPTRVEEQKNDGPVEAKTDKVKSANEREKSEIAKPVNEEVTCLESPMLIDDENKTQHASEPMRVEEQKNDGPVESKTDKAKSANEREKSEIAKPVNEEVTLESPMLIDDGNKTQHASETMRVEEQKSDGPVEPKTDKVKSANEREKSEIAKPVKEEVICVESPMLIDDGNKTQHALPERPLRRFTRSALKSKPKPVEILETLNDASFALADVKGRKNSELKEEPKSNSVKSLSEENRRTDLVTLGTPAREVKLEEEGFEKLNSDKKISEVGEQLKNDPTRVQTEEGTSVESTMVIDGFSEVQNASLKGPPRRCISPTDLKPKVEPMEVSTSAGGDSVGSAYAKDEKSATGGSLMSEEAKTGPIEGDECKTTDVISPLRASPKKKLEMKMSKKISLTKFPSKLRELLDTGMLEGLTVKYLLRGKKGLRGLIKDSGILCCCPSCEGCKVITPIQFEIHAGSLNKRPADYIYLENGNSFRDVMNACKDAPLDSLEATIQRAIGSSPEKDATVCQNCKRPFTASCTRRSMHLCSSCVEAKECQDSPPCITGATSRSSKLALTPKCSTNVSKGISPPNGSKGKITRKDLRLHKLVFEEGGLPEGTEVAYYARGQKLLEGYKKGFGIFCRCCNSEVSPSQFEAHAGWASRRKPYLHIYTSNGVSLHELSISLSKDRKLSAKDSDDLCTICADGGDLLLCDGCPRAFHKACVCLSNIPHGDWYCKYCQNMFQREKFGEHNVNARAAGRVSGVDPIEQISQRCIRIVKTSEAEVGGCALCRGHGFSKSGFGPRTVLLCDQCEKEFHVGCLRDHKMADLRELPQGKWFCRPDCFRIHTVLQKLLVRGPEKMPESLSNIIKKKHEENGEDGDLDVRWRLLSGKLDCPETKLLLAKAVAIFGDRFDPIVDFTTGRDLIPSMVYGRNIRGQEFGGMYCAVLTVNSSVVSAGIFRIFGTEVAELPLVATSSDKQGQGYFQSLFSCIERLLGFLHVKTLVLPAADEAESIWTKKFGFMKIAPDELSKLRRDCQMMTFQGTSMLQKPVPKCRVVGKSSGS
ncbi:remodeling and spacing factor 1-like [Telopea speciosissima]|uniref:remodeling and spacing factor 1-like n=1 Tax=Telopea speciosissima TaxID=54955 RepID=UPI001CC6B752|nr:remodeling and spacing factor 1-like [Telopea speciosissima]